MKRRKYNQELNSVYFWRTKKGQEIDFVEEYGGGEEYRAYECKLSDKNIKLPNLFKETYMNSKLKVVSKTNIVDDLVE